MQDYPFTPAKINNNSKQQKSASALPTTNALEKSALIKRINKSDWLTLQKQLLVEYQKQNDMLLLCTEKVWLGKYKLIEISY